MQDGITKRNSIAAGMACLGPLVLSGWLAAGEGGNRPNVLIITTDQQRVDATSAAGNQWLKTPHMDSLAAGGVYFTQSSKAERKQPPAGKPKRRLQVPEAGKQP
jgi:hypothetical protein